MQLPLMEKLRSHPSERAAEQHQLRQEDSCYFKHPRLAQCAQAAGGKKSPSSATHTAQSNQLKFQINVPTPWCFHTATQFSVGSCVETCQQELQELPNHGQIACRCNQNPGRDYASGWKLQTLNHPHCWHSNFWCWHSTDKATGGSGNAGIYTIRCITWKLLFNYN